MRTWKRNRRSRLPPKKAFHQLACLQRPISVGHSTNPNWFFSLESTGKWTRRYHGSIVIASLSGGLLVDHARIASCYRFDCLQKRARAKKITRFNLSLRLPNLLGFLIAIACLQRWMAEDMVQMDRFACRGGGYRPVVDPYRLSPQASHQRTAGYSTKPN